MTNDEASWFPLLNEEYQGIEQEKGGNLRSIGYKGCEGTPRKWVVNPILLLCVQKILESLNEGWDNVNLVSAERRERSQPREERRQSLCRVL